MIWISAVAKHFNLLRFVHCLLKQFTFSRLTMTTPLLCSGGFQLSKFYAKLCDTHNGQALRTQIIYMVQVFLRTVRYDSNGLLYLCYVIRNSLYSYVYSRETKKDPHFEWISRETLVMQISVTQLIKPHNNLLIRDFTLNCMEIFRLVNP